MKIASQFFWGTVIVGCWYAIAGVSGDVFAKDSPQPGPRTIDYRRDIQPILSRNCFTCHGPDEATREAGLRLDHRDSDAVPNVDDGEHHGTLVPGHADRSELFLRITSDDESLRMPPADGGRSLTASEINTIELWIQQGADYAAHWAFIPPEMPDVPPVKNRSWPHNSIDHFILANLERMGVAPSPEADRATLIRRLSFDLIGLPPTTDKVDAFVEDSRPDAYPRLVDSLLASPQFGERWAKHWLDLARYADSDGYLGDTLRPYAHLYRDWVIDAINQDMPFDRFTVDQIAGDLVPKATLQQKIATGFNRNAMKNTEAGADREEDRVNRTVNYVSTMGTVWLGLTIGCAECHTHKYDPISHHEFYRLYAFFNNVEDRDVSAVTDDEVAGYERSMGEWTEALGRHRQTLTAASVIAAGDCDEANGSEKDAVACISLKEILPVLHVDEKQRKPEQVKLLEAFLSDLDDHGREKTLAYQKLALAKPSPPATKAPTIAQASTDKQRPTRVHLRGNFRNLGDEVHPATPEVLHPLHPRAEQPDRLDLANWLIDPANPLTHRTTVNHIWKHLFGHGLVQTTDNLGMTGDTPSNRELLDWLALESVRRQWSRKDMIRLIVHSATYRQSSDTRPDLRDIDPNNIWLARQSRFRVEAEVVRDAALSVSGQLNTRIGGPSIRPPLDPRVTMYSRNKDWPISLGAEIYRRGLYVLFRRNTPYSMLITFDAPDTSVACAQRERTHSPLQALTLLNDPVFHETAQHLGQRLTRDGGNDPPVWIRQAFRICLARQPRDEELSRLVGFYHDQRGLLETASDETLKKLIGQPLVGYELPDQAARVAVARCLINVNEFITRE